MITIKEKFKCKVGYSDHSEGILVPIVATSLGASIIEKHLTLNKKMEGPDHQASLEPENFKKMVEGIRQVGIILGSKTKKVSQSEKKNIEIARKSIVASKKIIKGEILCEANLLVKRPGNGISPMKWDQIIGTRAKKIIMKMSKSKKKIIFISTSRSDFDLQKGLILKLQKKFNCKLICGPQHFYKNSGYSYTDVSNSGIKNIKKLISIHDNKKTILLNNFFFENFSKEINLYKPDLACLFGDRSEILIAAFNLYFQNVKIIHFHGGEVTHGSKDDGYRHSISKLSDFHIVTTAEHKKRLIQLGEYKKNIFNFGSLSLDENLMKDKKKNLF